MPTPPLNPHVRIVDEQGRPTPEFIRWAQSQRDVNENIPETAQSASGVLDLIGATRGSLLYRAVSNWNELVPGLAGRFLRSNGVGADPSWQTAAFTDLSDVDTDYTGHAGEAVLVNATEDGLEYGAVSGGGSSPTVTVQAVTSAASLVFAVTGANMYMLFDEINATSIRVTVSVDGGTSYLAGTDYRFVYGGNANGTATEADLNVHDRNETTRTCASLWGLTATGACAFHYARRYSGGTLYADGFIRKTAAVTHVKVAFPSGSPSTGNVRCLQT